MAPAISFWAGEGFEINNLVGSGLGFYGAAGFGASVDVGEFSSRTFITDSAGAIEGEECDNCKFLNSSGVIVGQAGSGILLTALPNYLSTLNIRFTNDSAVMTQNASLRIYDRSTPASGAISVTTKVAEIRHTDTAQTANGSGDATWSTWSGSTNNVSAKSLVASPGSGGYRPSGSSTSDTQHDWFLAISPSPDAIGSHSSFGLWFSVEYL